MKSLQSVLARKIRAKNAKISVVGQGYVGLPLAVSFAQRGFRVTGIDSDPGRVRAIMKGKSHIGDIPSAVLSKWVRRGRLRAVTGYQHLAEADVIIVCVPTPLNRVKDPDISFIVDAANGIKQSLRKGQLISLESTTYPGTTEEVILPTLEESGLKVGRDFFLVFSPERIDPGNRDFENHDIPKVVGGITPACTKLGCQVYGAVTRSVVPVSTARTAEMAKLLENTFRIVNIGLVNELAKASEKLQINIWEAIDAAKTKPFGFMAFYPGPGIGGHCIGVDPLYLSWKARMHGTDLHFIDLARRMNAEMPRYIVSKAVYSLNQFRKKAISMSRVLVLGVTYKKDVADTRESPALDILHELALLGARVHYHDPYVPQLKHQSLSLKSEPLTRAVLRKQDLVILTTDHSRFDYPLIVRNAPLIFDTRNRLKRFTSDKIVRL